MISTWAAAVFGDNAAPRGGNGATLYWSPDGRWLFDIVAKQGRTPLVRVDAQIRRGHRNNSRRPGCARLFRDARCA